MKIQYVKKIIYNNEPFLGALMILITKGLATVWTILSLNILISKFL